MIQLTDAGKHFGSRSLFEGVSWLIGPKDRVGLVGANGTGKSTLLKILCGMESLDEGSVARTRGITAGYLPQEGLQPPGRTVFAECLSVFETLRDRSRKSSRRSRGGWLRSTRNRPSTSRSRSGSTTRSRSSGRGTATRSRRRWARCSPGWASRRTTGRRPTEEFSGGWQMRLALAKLLLERPNLLLLDEPTNHLDLEARNWLEVYLDDYPHAYVLVSHDRFFLDVTVRRVVELWNSRHTLLRG